jgi:hypothetical protein
MKVLIMQSLPASCHVLLGSDIFLSNLFSDTLNPRSTLNVRVQDSHQYKTTSTTVVLFILVSKFIDRSREDRML